MQHLYIHPENPQQRLINQAVSVIKNGGVIAYPTDTAYALGCAVGEKNALARISALRQLEKNHQFTLICRDLSEIATYAKVDNQQYRLLKAHTPAPITFILQATREVPKRLMHPKKKTIGIRVPSNPICQALLATLDAPMLTSTLILPNTDDVLPDDEPMDDPYEIALQLEHQLDSLIDAGISARFVSSVVDLSGDEPVLIRQGIANVDGLL